MWNDHALLMIVWRWDAFEGLETLKGFGAALGLVRKHAADGTPEHLCRGTIMPWSTSFCIVAGLFAEEGLVLYCVAAEWVSI